VPETAQSNANSGNVELKQLSGVFDSGWLFVLCLFVSWENMIIGNRKGNLTFSFTSALVYLPDSGN
jgi:hypothetical protein